jgi:hypothetical protein
MGIAAQSSAWGHSSRAAFTKAVAALIAFGLLLGGCFQETYHKGYILPEGAL